MAQKNGRTHGAHVDRCISLNRIDAPCEAFLLIALQLFELARCGAQILSVSGHCKCSYDWPYGRQRSLKV